MGDVLMPDRETHLRLFDGKVIAGSCAMGIGFGLVRFDFGAIARVMVQADWVSTTGIGQLAGLNLLAFLLGSFHHSLLSSHKGILRVLRVALVVIVLSFWFAAFEPDLWGQAFTRVCTGWAAGHMISGIPPLALAQSSSSQRRKNSAMVLAGGGAGALIGACSIGIFAPSSPQMAWVVLAICATALAFPVFWLLRSSIHEQLASAQSISTDISMKTPEISIGQRWRVAALLIGGGLLLGAGQVPVTLYTPMVVSQRLGLDPSVSSESLAVLGLGSSIGALVAATFPRRWATASLLPLASIIGLIGSLLFSFSDHLSTVLLATFLIGIWMWVTLSLTYDRLGELVTSPGLNRRLWALMATTAGLGYATFSFSFSNLASSNLNAVLFIGVFVIAFQFLMEIMQGRSVQ